ncbi:PREDICTED: gamma-aminobutyric acid receptor-associated protein-like 2 [Bison bison bison]|uniref:Gamma-aminobutyric acid receptor-associated protein-like 2 n=1 Tax=Bison bison bison TaxID=43346 RepID=A0A6P3I3U3_BISBB|nr:PREDICTED: gamma-aminobutyric acid receptor-associated protein-like 2 [Bison bison bison]
MSTETPRLLPALEYPLRSHQYPSHTSLSPTLSSPGAESPSKPRSCPAPCRTAPPLDAESREWRRKPRPSRLLGSGSRKSRLPWPGLWEPAGGQARPSAPCVSPSEHRCVESAKIRAKYPDRVPVIVEKVSGSQIVDIDKRKYLVPSDITVAQFMWIIRKRIQLPSEKAIFLFVDKTVPQSSLTMGQLYEKEKDEDGFLYVAYSGENTFGF